MIDRPSPRQSPVDNYRRIKQEEAAARAMLMAKPIQARPSMGHKYKPSENALAAYSPLREASGVATSQNHDAGMIPGG